MASPRAVATPTSGPQNNLVSALASCATEADIAQVLYAELHPRFGYEVIVLQVLEREGWFHAVPIDHGVLQDVVRRPVSTSMFAPSFEAAKPAVIYTEGSPTSIERGRGPGVAKRPYLVIWVPIHHRGQPIAAIVYQSTERRPVGEDELSFLEYIHSHLGVVVSNAYLNEITRNQAVSLSALNAIARALSATLDEAGVVAALHSTLAPLLPVDRLELVFPESEDAGKVRLLRFSAESGISRRSLSRGSKRIAAARHVLDSGKARLSDPEGYDAGLESGAWVPVLEGGQIRAVLSIHSAQPEAYEQSTLVFLEQVADEVSLALRNAWSYAAIEAQRRRLEVVNAVGRRLASSLDRWSIMRTLREELARHLEFDLFSLAAVTETPEGPLAEGYVYDSGEEQPLAPLQLAAAGPSREAYETGLPVLIRRSPWARSFETDRPATEDRFSAGGAIIAVTRPGHSRRVAARSIVWVPVRHGDRITALLSLQSYRANVFSDWHVDLLQDVAAHVSLALANADHFHVAQTERRRLEALHVLEMGIAGASDEAQIAEAVFGAARGFIEASHLVLAYLDAQGRLTGFDSDEGEPAATLQPKPVDSTTFFKRLVDAGVTIVERVAPELRQAKPGLGWRSRDRRLPQQVAWVPVFQGGRVVGAISAQRYEDQPFVRTEIQLLESAAPVVGIALRTVRLHRANELALAHSVRLQEVAALAGHDLAGVVASVVEQARTMFDAAGTACWAFDDDGRVTARAAAGGSDAARILQWSGRTEESSWAQAPRSQMGGIEDGLAWTLIPLWYADRLVGALGSVSGPAALEDQSSAPVDFARHAAIAMENARLAAETRGRIHTLEAVAAFTDLDITRPEGTRAEMGRLIERALEGSHGGLWLIEGPDMVRVNAGAEAPRVQLGAATPAPAGTESRLRTLLRALPRPPGEIYTTPISVDGHLVGMVTAAEGGASPGETRRLMSVLAGQAAVVLGRLQLVAALDRQARMMNAILSHSPVGVILEDADGRVVYANPEIEQIYGVPADRLAGTQAGLLLEAAASVTSEPDAEPGAPLEVHLRGSGTVVEVRRVPITGSAAEPAGVLSLHEDVTQERMVLEAKDLMLRAIGHEVRSPAAAMRSTIAGLLQWDLVMDPEQRHTLIEEAYDQSDRLLSLVENQLIMSKLETHQFEPNRAAVPLERSLGQVVSVLGSRYGRRIDIVRSDLDPRLRPAWCEPTHLDQVLTNLVGNALEYTQAGRVDVSAREQGGFLEVTVADDGAGLPPDRVQSLFQKTGPAGQNRARGGLGLGLYLSRLLVERSLGGSIWLERTGPAGTTFRFTVLAAEVPVSRDALPAAR